MIDLYYWFMFNGYKIMFFFEEIGLEYVIKLVNIGMGEQFVLDFLVIVLNNWMLVIVDYDLVGGGVLILVFELGVILFYFVDKIGCFIGYNVCSCIEVMEWLMWQMGGFGLMFGQNYYFNCYVFEKIFYVIDWYVKEINCLYGVFDCWLEGCDFIVGDYLIVDMVVYLWIVLYEV